jgi:hypothetical protein
VGIRDGDLVVDHTQAKTEAGQLNTRNKHEIWIEFRRISSNFVEVSIYDAPLNVFSCFAINLNRLAAAAKRIADAEPIRKFRM